VLLDQGVAGAQGADQGRQLQWIGLPVKQGAGEGHAFGLVVGGTDARMEAAHPGAEALTGSLVAGFGVVGDRGWEGGGHGERDRTRRAA